MYQVTEVYRAIQGEGWWSGTPCTMVRLAGCNLRCPFCDTPNSLGPDAGDTMLLPELVDRVDVVHVPGQMILITGGEPTLQPLGPLVRALKRKLDFVEVHLETNGTRELPKGTYFDWITVSPKTTWCGESARVSIGMLKRCDEIKWLVETQEDVLLLLQFLGGEVRPDCGFKRISVQPISQVPSATEIAYQACLTHSWRLSLQLHRYIGKE